MKVIGSNENQVIQHAHGCGGDTIGQTKPIIALSRRGFLRTGVAGASATVSLGMGFPRRAGAQSTLSPDAALQKLVEGNKRFVEQRLTSPAEDLTILKQKTAPKQEPFAAVLACADSRVPVELTFDQSIGHVFVTRVAGNIATSEIIASLEYGAAVLGTKAILVLGHSSCGAAKAAIEGKAVPGQISQLFAPLRPAIDAAGTDVDAVAKANAKIQARLIASASPLLGDMIKGGKLKIAAGFYDIATGEVTILT
jgi:carbonic anhydrase